MTKALNEMDPVDALYAACRQYPDEGIKGLARVRDTTPAGLYQKLDRHNPRGRVGYCEEDLFSLLEQLRARGVPNWNATLVALCARFGAVYVQLPEAGAVGDESAAQLTLDGVREFSEFMAEFTQDVSRGMDAKAMERVRKEGHEALRQIQQMMAWAERLHEEWKEKHPLRAVA